jgi:hypothetical protein
MAGPLRRILIGDNERVLVIRKRRSRFLRSDDFDGVPSIGRLREPRPVVDGQAPAWCRVV